MDDPYRLERFTQAQDDGGTYQRAVAELRAGRKVSHWMWFVFPQVAGLGFSATSQRYAISGRAEAQAYLNHPVLGPRLTECARIVASTEGRSAGDIFGPVDPGSANNFIGGGSNSGLVSGVNGNVLQ